ncbi:MAG: heme lyase CcmF/NrfE family subunit [Myxococcota bacterium]|nr:heme lyase CcmF/NrfE family subunit [Myxococcota bacterium]
MHATTGNTLILSSVALALAGAILSFSAGRHNSPTGTKWGRWCAYGYAATMVLANLVMVRALLVDDFSVSYVAQVGSRSVPTWVSVVSLWSSLEGSILFWGAILGFYMVGFCKQLENRYPKFVPYANGVLLLNAAFFAIVIAGPANPFQIMDPIPLDGPGPNPLLQNHILMVVHPPLLYLGYVGMSVPFSIAIAALLRGELTSGWLKPLRYWTMIPWTFLTLGIIVGAWWAYEVLGWGGYWAWDPVENASFLPWLAATGYLHSTVVQERKGILKVWTLTSVICAFLLTILGTFMTRSGVFNSVHSFTQSSIGPIFLGFLATTAIFSMALLAMRSHLLEDEGTIESPLSRESAFLLNNLIFVVFTFTVLIGTVYPLITEAIKGVKLSVGEPYFNQMATPIGILMVFLMGIGPVLPWGRPSSKDVIRGLLMPASIGLLGAIMTILLEPSTSTTTLLALGVCTFAATVTAQELINLVRSRRARHLEPLHTSIQKTFASHRRKVGGYIVHFAIIAIVAAIAGNKTWKESVEASLTPGKDFQLGEYTFIYKETVGESHPEKFSILASFEVFHQDSTLGAMQPKLNYYRSQREPIGTPHVRTIGNQDIYLSLLAFEEQGRRVVVKAYIMPMVPWIWWSLPIIMLGSLISLWPRRKSNALHTGVVAT